MQPFTFYLVKWPNRKKTVEVQAHDLGSALEIIAEKFPDFQTSMFWPGSKPVNPQRKKQKKVITSWQGSWAAEMKKI